MSSTIKELTLNYDPVNETNTFSSGDVLQGRVFLEVAKEAKIDCFYIKCKGDADVSWTERHNDRTHTYHSHERYFKLKQVFIQDPSKPANNEPNVIISTGETYSNVVRPGRHVFPFCFQLPHGNMPPSFKGYYGSVKYILEVRVDRSWKMDRTAKAEINFVPRLGAGVNTMSPQSAAIDKKMKFFTSGSASMRATIDKMGYMQGDIIRVSTDVDNSSSRELKLKYSLEQKLVFFAQGRSKNSSKTIFKVVGDPVPNGSKQIVNTDLKIPPNLELTIASCSIIKLVYILKVYLDVPYASDPEITFPVCIYPAGQGPWQSPPSFQPYGPNPPPQAAFGPNPPPQVPFGPNPPPQVPFGPSHPPQVPFGPNPPPQVAFGPSPPGATFGPAPGLYPSLYPSPACPQPANPEAPPSYTDVYPNQNPTVAGFQPHPSAPSCNPPPYSAMGYPGPSAPQQNPAPSAPEFCPNPSNPPYSQAGGPPGYWPNSANPTNQSEPYPTKPPEEKHA
ncbi:arrestin domain-containing protein 3-like [Pygocentrus nattereri]|uniref:Arrestin C-terminal-like domain-containing protein n=1 Tax=Pygocentrus nattereri TaxID=42514 RepID=A0A3B4C5Y7_PYGNA|nr:arrestin domain-containing protein 3-like [Pygocentrus nattereri]